ncbi:MAG TPA: ABC transporter substrate-binding protein [Solirubrobacteraceae bacterium]|jgi:peptide/nickel transport system substrate-binding protein|nr:ABC transporter substrate-binding protein [Solirubrobacteraceae bacterium]
MLAPARPATASTPRYGGTLRYFGPGGMDRLDPACAYYALSHQIIRLFSRQLFGYPTTVDASGLIPAPDVAVRIPVPGDGLSADRRTCTIELRSGVLWDTDPPREVTAADFVRGLKRMCNPVAGAGALPLYTSTIRGMAAFAEGYREELAGTEPTAADLAAYQNGHEIAGLRAEGPKTLVIELTAPAGDLPNILCLTFASAAPREYDAYLPDSPELWRNMRSNGPYRLTGYEPGRRLTMERNPVWRQASDPLKHQYVDGLEVRIEPAGQARVRQALETGEADLSWGSPVVDPGRALDADRRLGFALNPYLVFNLHSPNAGGAVRDLRVRRAVAYAIDKVAVAELFDDMGTGAEPQPAHSAIPPGNFGHREHDRYPTPGDRGDPAKARRLLAEAGHGEGLRLRMLYREADVHPDVARSIAADLERCGIAVDLVGTSQSDEYYRVLQDPARARAGEWDLTAPSWTPDWFGNNGRAYLQPMFQSNFAAGTANYGGYENPEVDRLLAEALASDDAERAAELLHQVDRIVMEDAAIVPIVHHEPTIPHLTSSRVRNGIQLPHVDRWFDAANLWLDPPDAPGEGEP